MVPLESRTRHHAWVSPKEPLSTARNLQLSNSALLAHSWGCARKRLHSRDVLVGCSSSLVNVDNLFVEYHGRAGQAQTLHRILQILEQAGLRYHIKEANPVRHPFLPEERNSLYDLQLNVFAFRPGAHDQ